MGFDITPRGNPYRKLILDTPHGVMSFNQEDVVVHGQRSTLHSYSSSAATAMS